MELLRIEKLIGGEWAGCEMKEVKKDDTFRGFDKDAPAWDGESFVAFSDAYLNKDGIWTVQVEKECEDCKVS